MLESILAMPFSSPSDVGEEPNAPRLVVTATTYKDMDFADNFANNLLSLKVTNFVLVPLDMEAYESLKAAYPKHTVPVLPGLELRSVGKNNDIFAAFRPNIISSFLKQGYAVFYNDVETVWQSNAWLEIDQFLNTTVNQASQQYHASVESMFWRDETSAVSNGLTYFIPMTNSLSWNSGKRESILEIGTTINLH